MCRCLLFRNGTCRELPGQNRAFACSRVSPHALMREQDQGGSTSKAMHHFKQSLVNIMLRHPVCLTRFRVYLRARWTAPLTWSWLACEM